METLRLYDNTRLTAYRRCPRYYYHRHVRHWTRRGNEHPLIFGSAWHQAMDQIWQGLTENLPVEEVVNRAFAAFLTEWVENGMPPPSEIDYGVEEELAPRTPGRAYEMIVAYVDKRKDAIQGDLRLVNVERPFIVPLDPEDMTLFYVGKIDKVVERGGKKGGIEHKTSTAYKRTDGPTKFRSSFLDSFSPNSQVDGYLYALHLLFPDQVFGVWVDAALVHKSQESFTFIPIERQLAHLDMWLWETRSTIDQIEANVEELQGVNPDDRYMAAFPKNTNSCFDFNRACPYLDLCKAWPNPHHRDLPPDFEENFWDPLKHLEIDPENLSQYVAQSDDI